MAETDAPSYNIKVLSEYSVFNDWSGGDPCRTSLHAGKQEFDFAANAGNCGIEFPVTEVPLCQCHSFALPFTCLPLFPNHGASRYFSLNAHEELLL
jgi:hypothetical protein